MKTNTETILRTSDTYRLIDDFDLLKDQEYFENPKHRLDFLKALEPSDFISLLQHINARLRGLDPRAQDVRGETGSEAPLLGAPDPEDKDLALATGFERIKEYLESTSDTTVQQIQAAGMATEALIVWTHRFNDGNGRTSRFIGKFIEDGTTNFNALAAETADNMERLRDYGPELRVDPGNFVKQNEDLLVTDDEYADEFTTVMTSVDGIAASIDRLLQDKDMQEGVLQNSSRMKETRKRFLQKPVNKAA